MDYATTRTLVASVCLFSSFLCPAPVAQAWPPTSIYPGWADVAPIRTISISHDPGASNSQNGARLFQSITALQPGDTLQIGPGTWSIDARFVISLQGTASAPIRIRAADPGRRPIITRSNRSQNVINIGDWTPTRFVALQDLEIVGGSDMIRIYDARDLWIDRCWLHDGGGVGIVANTDDTERLFFTNNHIERPGYSGRTGEGFYLGSDNGSVTTSWSVVAFNHVHDTTAASQGDGIEIKQGSHHNWIVGNVIHDTRYPGILVYGTAGNGQNLIDRNVIWNTINNGMQVQGEAIVTNNLIMNSGNYAFSSHDHKAPTRDLWVAHNTFIDDDDAVSLSRWGGRAGMGFVNNAVYSRSGYSVQFGSNDSTGVTLRGNVVMGTVRGATSGHRFGSGLSDFVDVSWDASRRDARPRVGTVLDGGGDLTYGLGFDGAGARRAQPVDAGAFESDPSMFANNATISVPVGGNQTFSFACGPQHAGREYLLIGSLARNGTLLHDGLQLPFGVDSWFAFTAGKPSAPGLVSFHGRLDGQGAGSASLSLPPLPTTVLSGTRFEHALCVWEAGRLVFVSNAVDLELR